MMKFTVLSLLLGLSSPQIYAHNHESKCSCNKECKENCQKGKTDKCECKECGCKQTNHCPK